MLKGGIAKTLNKDECQPGAVYNYFGTWKLYFSLKFIFRAALNKIFVRSIVCKTVQKIPTFFYLTNSSGEQLTLLYKLVFK